MSEQIRHALNLQQRSVTHGQLKVDASGRLHGVRRRLRGSRRLPLLMLKAMTGQRRMPKRRMVFQISHERMNAVSYTHLTLPTSDLV